MAECHLPFSGHCDLDSLTKSLKYLCPEHISYSIRGRKPKFVVCMYLGTTKCRVPFLGHCDLDLWPSFFLNNRVWSISLVLFEIGILNLVCGCILGWWIVVYCLWIPMTLTY